MCFSVPSPATFETPQNVRQNDPVEDINSKDNGKEKEMLKKTESGVNESGRSVKGLSLDQYLNSHTSEDNESFKEIQKESVKRHKLKYAWLYKDEDAINSDFEKNLKVPSIEQQAGAQEKPLAIDTWTYKNQNQCMFVPDGEFHFTLQSK